MKKFPEGMNVSLEFPFTDLNGDPLVPNTLTAKLYDAANNEIEDLGIIAFQPGDEKATVTVLSSQHALGISPNALRTVVLTITTDAGEIKKKQSYIVIGEFELIPYVNTFATDQEAIMLAVYMKGTADFLASDTDTVTNSLIGAFTNICRLNLQYKRYVDDKESTYVISKREWPIRDEAVTDEFPEDFIAALKRAQIAEAASIAANDIIEQKHEQGIISETVSESSIMLRGTHLRMGVCQAAYRELAGYIYMNASLART